MICYILLFLFPLIWAPGGAGEQGPGEGCCLKKQVADTRDGLDGEYSLIQGRDTNDPNCHSNCVYTKYQFLYFLFLFIIHLNCQG